MIRGVGLPRSLEDLEWARATLADQASGDGYRPNSYRYHANIALSHVYLIF